MKRIVPSGHIGDEIPESVEVEPWYRQLLSAEVTSRRQELNSDWCLRQEGSWVSHDESVVGSSGKEG